MVQIAADTADPKVRAKRREILIAASKSFRDRGFHAVGMRDVAARAGMTVGNLYYYFRSKEDLLAFCQEDTLSRLLELVETVHRSDAAPDERLGALVRGHLACLNETVPASLAHLEVAEPGSAIGRRLVELRRRYEHAVRAIIGEGLEDGTFAAADSNLASMAILGALNWTVRWYSPDGPRSIEEIGESFARQLVNGLRPRLDKG